MARKARQRISYGTQPNATLHSLARAPMHLRCDATRPSRTHAARLPCFSLTLTLAVLPLANQKGGHRLGVNGLAIDTDSSVLYAIPARGLHVLPITYRTRLVNSHVDIPAAATASFAPGTSAST